MNGTPIQKHKTSFGTDAGTLTLLLFLLAIFRGVLPAVSWGFAGIALIFWLSERSSAYFRKQAAQLTVLLGIGWAVQWLFSTLSNLINSGRIYAFTQNIMALAEVAEYYTPEEFFSVLSSNIGSLYGSTAVFSFLIMLVNIAVFVLLIMGALNARRRIDWDMPVIFPLACKLDEKLHRGVRTF